jgi:DNA-binding NtrC family response regulator
MSDAYVPRRRFRWPDLFQESVRPLFVLNRSRRLRFVNAAWESLTGRVFSEVAGMACVRNGPTEPLFRVLAPPPEAIAGRVATVRRPVPPHRLGPPWWDVTFIPLSAASGAAGFLGLIHVIAAEPPVPPRKLPAVVAAIREQHAAAFSFELFAGSTPDAERLFAQARLATETTAPVWIVGESGSGKETLARVIHHQGTMAERAFVGLDCSGVQPYLIEALLFGHGGLAASQRIGTLYLKEPSSLPRDMQQRFADWLAESSLRIISGSTVPAVDDVQNGKLLPDFHAYLSVIELRLPPLRERLDDLPRIVEHLVGRLGTSISSTAFEVLRAHHWPGNIRELADVLSESVRSTNGNPIAVEHLPRYVRERALVASDPRPPAEPKLNLDALLEGVEKRLIELALRKAGGNQTDAASLLGIFRARIGRRIEALGIKSP